MKVSNVLNAFEIASKGVIVIAGAIFGGFYALKICEKAAKDLSGVDFLSGDKIQVKVIRRCKKKC
jgi:hypothetical protein